MRDLPREKGRSTKIPMGVEAVNHRFGFPGDRDFI